MEKIFSTIKFRQRSSTWLMHNLPSDSDLEILIPSSRWSMSLWSMVCKKSSKIKIHFWRNIDWQTLHREINNNYTLLQFQRVFTCFDRLQALIDTVYWIYKVSFGESTTISRSRNCFAPKTEESRAYSFQMVRQRQASLSFLKCKTFRFTTNSNQAIDMKCFRLCLPRTRQKIFHLTCVPKLSEILGRQAHVKSLEGAKLQPFYPATFYRKHSSN